MFRFENQSFIYLLILVLFFIVTYIFLEWRDKRREERYCVPSLWKKLTMNTSQGMRHLKFSLLMLVLICFIFAAANPQTAGKVEKVKRKGVDIMFCLDVSNSMLANDIAPTRLDACKMAINRLIDKLQGDRVGLVVFAGKSFVQLPITTDYAAAKMFINQINPSLIGEQGTDIAAALETAAAAMLPQEEEISDQKEQHTSRVIVLASDGEDHFPESATIAAELAKNGFVIHTIGIGSTKGVPIPISANNKQFKKDAAGNTVITRLNEYTLQNIANSGKGLYVHANNANMGFETILNEINNMEKSDIEDINFSLYDSYFQYPLLLGLLLLFVETLLFSTQPKIKQWLTQMRRPYKASTLIILCILCIYGCNHKKTRPSFLQQGNIEFSKGDSLRKNSYFEPDSLMPYDTTGNFYYQMALEIYDSTANAELVNCNQTLFNQIAAHYRLGNFDTVPGLADSLRRMTIDKEFTANVYYNEGNNYLQTKQYGRAVATYKEVLKRHPQDQDAKYNLVYAQKMQQAHGDGGGGGSQNQQQQQKQQQQQQQQNQQGNNDQKDDNQQQQNQSQQQGQQQNQQQGQQGQQGQQEKSDMMRQLDALQQNERQTQKKINVQRIPTEQKERRKQEKDW